MTKKIIAKIMVFVLLVVLLITYLSMVFTFPRKQGSDMARERFNSFYALPDNTVDGVFIGTSGVDRYWIPQLAFKEKGITVYGLTSGNQPIPFVKYFMEEAMKKHDVKTFIVDIRAVSKKPKTINDTDIRRATDNFRFSSTKFRATKAILDFLDEGETKVDTSDVSYYFRLAKYHAMWHDLTLKDFYDLYPKSEHMGYFGYNHNAYEVHPQKRTVVSDARKPINERNEKALLDLLDYCDGLDAKVIFVSSPQSPKNDILEQYNYAFDIIKSRGYETIDFNTEEMYEAVDWDFSHDLYNHGHANIYGAVKYTRWISDYLIKNCGLEDRRKDEDQSKYQDWYDCYENTMNELKAHDQDYYNEIYTK